MWEIIFKFILFKKSLFEARMEFMEKSEGHEYT